MQIKKHMVAFSYRMGIGMCVGTTPLKVLATDQTRINVDSCQGHRAKLFEIKIEIGPVYGVKVWTQPW